MLTGAGRAFSAGGDLDWITSFLDDPAARDESLREGAQIIEELLRFPLPVIAAVNGPAVGLGCSIAVLCDIVLISDRAFLADPHVSVGLVAGDGGAAFWPLLTPILRSREYLYTGDRIPAATAVELGLATAGGDRRGPAARGPSSWRTGWRSSPPRRCGEPSAWPACTWRRPSPGRCRRVSPPSGRPCEPPSTGRSGAAPRQRARGAGRDAHPDADLGRVPGHGPRLVPRALPAGWRGRADRSAGRRVRGVPALVVHAAARGGVRGAALAGRMGRRDAARPAGRALPGTGRARRAAAGAGVRLHPSRSGHAAGRRHRRAAGPAPAGHPGR